MDTIDAARKKLKEAWQAMEERFDIPDGISAEDYAKWSGLTKDMLFAMGMYWEPDILDYAFDPLHQESGVKINLVEENEALTP